MIKLNLETKTKEHEIIKAYLEENASEALADKINNGIKIQKDNKTLINKKTLEGFMNFAKEEARKQAQKGASFAMIENEVVYGWAIHYFEEESIEEILLNEDLELKSTNNYVCIIAKSKAELIKEGEILHHCVGRMNYDKKFTREESLIFFIRNSNSIETPLVTIEYNIQSRKVLQCYGNHDSTPDDSIMKFVYNKWLPYTNKKLEKIVA